MINVDEFKKAFYFELNKDGRGTVPSPEEFDLLAERSLWEWINKRFGNQEEYQPGRPVAPVSYEITQSVIDDLRHLKESRNILVSGGSVPLPDGTKVDARNQVMPEYLHLAELRNEYFLNTDGKYSRREVPFELLRDSEFGSRTGSTLRPPTEAFPIANIQPDEIRIAPDSIDRVILVYLRKPSKPNWAYTTTNGRPVYDSANSTHIDAPQNAFNQILENALYYAGARNRDQQVVENAKYKQQTGS